MAAGLTLGLFQVLPSYAQEAQPQPPVPSYVPIDEKAWRDMQTYFFSLSMPGPSHAAVQEYMNRMQSEAQTRQLQRRTTEGRK